MQLKKKKLKNEKWPITYHYANRDSGDIFLSMWSVSCYKFM